MRFKHRSMTMVKKLENAADSDEDDDDEDFDNDSDDDDEDYDETDEF